MIYADVKELLPQQPPYIFVDCIVDISPSDATTLMQVWADSPLVTDGKLQEAGILENIAQTCAVHIGYYSDDIKIGVVGAVPSLEIMRLPRVDEILETTVTVTAEVFNMRAVDVQVCCTGTPIARGSMKSSLT